MNSTQFARQIESEDKNSLQISNQTLNNVSIIQADLSEDNIFCFLNLSDSPQERECSCELPDELQIVKTKKHKIIIKKQNQYQYQCGYCDMAFFNSCGLGGHVQKNHKKEKNQNATISSIRLRTRPLRNCQH